MEGKFYFLKAEVTAVCSVDNNERALCNGDTIKLVDGMLPSLLPRPLAAAALPLDAAKLKLSKLEAVDDLLDLPVITGEKTKGIKGSVFGGLEDVKFSPRPDCGIDAKQRFT